MRYTWKCVNSSSFNKSDLYQEKHPSEMLEASALKEVLVLAVPRIYNKQGKWYLFHYRNLTNPSTFDRVVYGRKKWPQNSCIGWFTESDSSKVSGMHRNMNH